MAPRPRHLVGFADYAVQHKAYPPGYFFPPSNAILAHLYGLLDRDLAFRIYLVAQVAAVAGAMWAWARLLRLATRPSRSLVLLAGFLAALVYTHIELAMHNTNAVTFGLASLGLALPQRRQFSAACFALSLAIKPYSSVFILPWMAWNGRRAWAASALAWLFGFYAALPVAWFGAADTLRLYREWIGNVMAAAGDDGPQHVSMLAGVAALARAWPASWIDAIALTLQAAWLCALIAFFAPTALRRTAPSATAFACEAAAILLIGLPLGAHQQPARGVTLLASTLVIGSAAFDFIPVAERAWGSRGDSNRDRGLALRRPDWPDVFPAYAAGLSVWRCWDLRLRARRRRNKMSLSPSGT